MNTEKQFWGHPRGLATLFFTEMWERFSYYGMRALLILYMTADASSGGLAFDVKKAGAIYGIYTAMAYMTSLPGGWIADRFLGQRRAVLIGGIIIAFGHFCLAFHDLSMFYFGLVLIVSGTGLLKPNASTMVGGLYSQEDKRRDAGFSIFYMGINLGAMISPIICGYLGQKFDWHYGFAAAGFGMVIGVVQYVLGGKYLGDVGLKQATNPEQNKSDNRKLTMISVSIFACLVVGYLLNNLGVISINAESLTGTAGTLLIILPVLYFGWIFLKGGWEPVEKKRITVIAILFVFSSMFWSAFEQAGSTLNLFADRYTNNSIFGFEFPSSWFQSVNSIFIVSLAPVFAWLWIRLGKREPSSPAKFANGLFFVGLGFLLVAGAALISGPQGDRVSPMWLVGVYLLHTIGELCLSPVGLSIVTKLAPQRIAAQMMGVWFLSISVGNFIGGQVAGYFESFPLPTLFGSVFATTAVAALILVLMIKPIRKLMGGVH